MHLAAGDDAPGGEDQHLVGELGDFLHRVGDVDQRNAEDASAGARM